MDIYMCRTEKCSALSVFFAFYKKGSPDFIFIFKKDEVNINIFGVTKQDKTWNVFYHCYSFISDQRQYCA